MLRQLLRQTKVRPHQWLQLQPYTPVATCLMSTAPRPSQGTNTSTNTTSISYQEWAAQNLNKKNTHRSSQRDKTPNYIYAKPRRVRPSKYKSLVYFPDQTILKYPNASFELECEDFAIAEPGKGGHVVLGPNGSGKSLLVQQLVTNAIGKDCKVPPPHQIGFVSFDSHLKILQEHPYRTVHDSITGGTGNLSKAAQYLVVRFGLYPILHRTLSTLSTGEIRKALLVSALAKQPKLLVLENAFDGLDAKSRQELKTIVSKTIQGLEQTGKLLVQHVNADYVPPAQVLLSTHRPEEIVHEISTISYIETATDGTKKNTLRTTPRPPEDTQEQLLYHALGVDKNHNKNTRNWSILAPWEDPNPTLPSIQDMERIWPSEPSSCCNWSLLSLDNVQIQRRRDGVTTNPKNDQDFATLLHPLSWEIQKGQRWLIAGGNGAGKSTLSRFLLSSSSSPPTDPDTNSPTQDLVSGNYQRGEDTTIGWVSTESHLGQYQQEASNATMSTTAWDTISHNGTVDESIVQTMIDWVFGEDAIATQLKKRTLPELSQGEQKLVLIASALAKQPKLLVLDEPTQGLDWVHRRRVLALLERLCQANPELSLVYITHYQEEWIPSISHVLHLDSGRALYLGEKKEYNPESL